MKDKFGYLPPDKRKKVLLICDDIRVHSGIATVAREIVIHTAHHFNWINIAGAVQHPEKGQRFDLSEDTNKNAGIEDSSIFLYPVDGYGDAELIRQMIKFEKPDAIMLITDPRYFVWLFQIENEIRKHIPIVYLNIWDDYPAPIYNKPFYEACDLLMGISKQTVNINKIVLGEVAKNRMVKYIPHGLNDKIFRPIKESDKEYADVVSLKKQLFGKSQPEFIIFFNSRNIRRKQIPDALMAFRLFLDKLPKEQAKKCKMLLHTEQVSEHGTDLNAVIDLFFHEDYPNNIVFTNMRASVHEMSLLYNMCDAQILLTSNEGWGLSLTEAMLCGLPIIANVTGGMQDQMRFEFEDGTWIDFDENFPSNHRGTIKKHGEWAFPVYPTSRSIVGSPPTPYIYDDRCEAEDAADQIMAVYSLDKTERQSKGLKGREWAMSDEAGFTSTHQAQRVIDSFNQLFSTWKPRTKFEFINATTYPKRTLKHKLIY
jgi:glycosyltransferase involved in cell wall biosynthesis